MAVAVGRERQLAEDLFTEHSRLVYAYCLRRLRSPEEAEDALQATYLNACRFLLRGFEPEVGQAWLLRVAQNVCISRLRTKSRRGRFERAEDFHAVEELVPAPEVSDDELFGLEEALAGMPEQQRKAILLREWQGLSYREVAAELGLTQSAVETLIFRARRSLAKALETTPPKPRFVHAFQPAALLGSLKAGLATSVAVAASVAAVTSTPIVADSAPKVFAAPEGVVSAPARGSVPVVDVPEPAKLAVLSRVSFDGPGRGSGQKARGERGNGNARGHDKSRGKPARANGGKESVGAEKAQAAKSAPAAWGQGGSRGSTAPRAKK